MFPMKMAIKGGDIPAVPVHDADLALLYQFLAEGDLKGVDGLGPTLTCVRADATGTRVTSDLVMEADVPANTARFDWNPFTGQMLGLLIEETKENLALHSGDMSNAVWVANNITKETTEAVDVIGALSTNIRLTASAANGTLLQTVTSAADSYTMSIILKRITGTGNIEITADNGVSWQNVAPTFDLLPAGSYVRFFQTDAAETNPVIGIRIVESGDQVDCWGGDLVKGVEYPTTHVQTVASPVTRNADVISTTDMSWFNASAGTFYIKTLLSHFTGVLGQTFDVSDNSASDRIYVQRSAAEGAGGIVVAASVSQAAMAGDAHAENVVMRTAFAYSLNDVEFYTNGTRSGTGDQSVTLPTGISKLVLGNNFESGEALNGWIQEFRYYNVRKSNQFLEDLSNGLKPE